MSVYKSVSKSVFRSVHPSTKVPLALQSSVPGDMFTTRQVAYLDGEPYFSGPTANKYYLRDVVGSNHAGIKTPCLRNAAGVANSCSVGLFQLDGNFTISCWVKYEGSNTATGGPMFFGGGDQATGSDYRAHVWYRPSTGIWTFAVDGGSTRATVTNTVLEDNLWHHLQVSRAGTTYKITVDGVDLVSTTGTVTRFTLRQILQTYSSTYSLHGMMADFRVVDAAGVTWYFPLQDGEGSTSTNRNIAYCKSDGTGGVISNAISGGTVSDWWAARCPGYAKDWCIEYGGRIGAGGEFIAGLIGSGNAADGNAKTKVAGKRGNPFSSLNLNPSWLNSLAARGVPTELKIGTNINDQIAPFESAFCRRSSDGDDRIIIYGSARTGDILAAARLYTDTSAPTAWTLADLPGEIATEYFAAVAANSGTISAGNQTAVSNLLNGLHTQGLFDDVLALYLFHGNHLNAARLNAMNPTTVDGSGMITWSGSPTLNASGGITPSVGNYGIGPNPHILGLYESTFGGAGIGFYSTSNAATSERTIGNTTAFYLAPKYSSTSEFAASNGTPLTGAVQDLSGFHFTTREPGTDNIAAYRNGTSYATGTRSFTAIYTSPNDTGKIHIGGCNNNGAGNLASTTPIRVALVTKGLLAAQVSALNALISTYISELV